MLKLNSSLTDVYVLTIKVHVFVYLRLYKAV